MQKSLTIIGAGRVGTALAKALFKAGFTIDLVISGTAKSAAGLASQINTAWTTDSESRIKSEIVLLSVPDRELKTVAKDLIVDNNCCVLHTAGAFGIDVFDDLKCLLKGVLYPFQSFSPDREIEMSRVPFLVEGINRESLELAEYLAGTMSDNIYRVSTSDRKLVHVAGVFVNNFVNHLYGVGEDLVKKAGLPVEILYPLIDETREKEFSLGSDKSQTGPAVRNDTNTIEKHLELLSYSTELSDIYELLSDLITKRFSK